MLAQLTQASIAHVRSLHSRYDLWSICLDFFFVIGVFAFDWNPTLLILWFFIDTACMLIFGNILFYIENKSIILSIGFIFVCALILILLAGLYTSVVKFVIELNMEDDINTDPNQILNPISLPVILILSSLNHFSNFKDELDRMRNNTYSSLFLKHVFLRYILGCIILLTMVFTFFYFKIGIVVGLIVAKAYLRYSHKNWRTLL